MPVRFSTRAPNADYLGFEASPEAIITAAKKAEEVGFDAILVNDHIIVGNDTRSGPRTNVYDPFVAGSAAASSSVQDNNDAAPLYLHGGGYVIIRSGVRQSPPEPGSHETHCWREADSNSRSRCERESLPDASQVMRSRWPWALTRSIPAFDSFRA
jgi:hypothetical protein